jgi:hypothetical protein
MDVVASRLSWRRLPWVLELLFLGLGYFLYGGARALAPHQLNSAYDNAYSVIKVERGMGIFHELAVNQFLARHVLLENISSYYYATLHFIVTPLLLAWLWRYRRRVYAPLRSGLVLGTVLALSLYAAWPLAPPRFALHGTVDTVIRNPVVWATGPHVEGFINDLAAMPSLHVAWAVWAAMAVVASFRSSWRHLAWLYPVLTTLVVVATANHFVLAAVGGALIVLVPVYLCGGRLSLTAVQHEGTEAVVVKDPVAA